MMEIRCFSLPPIGTNSWLILPPDSNKAILVDAPLNAFATVEKIMVQTGRTLAAVLLTHGPWDHILDGWRFNTKNIPVYGHRADEVLFTQPASKMAAYAIPGLRMEPVQVDHWVGQGDVLELAGIQLEVREVPGHCPGNVLFYCAAHGFAAVGDALFAGSIGRTDLPGGSFEQLENSITSQIYTLPPETRILPGHGLETTAGEESQHNPYVTL